ncbi:hypothetical protein [Roseospira goensis]|uniref:Uncharacterized protein n=1 Tax=Roseospira goensis TaxID=391922 RepID=A0A7W6S2B9_9PROT|nr:hypothetical protein [Roseospira goensis]MBB4287615.1 hypothetical protein [Roseospira goensis]
MTCLAPRPIVPPHVDAMEADRAGPPRPRGGAVWLPVSDADALADWRQRAGATLRVPLVLEDGWPVVAAAAAPVFTAFVALDAGDAVWAVGTAGHCLATGVVAGPPWADPLGTDAARVDPGPALWVLRAAIARARREAAADASERVRLAAAARAYDRDLRRVLETPAAVAAAVRAPVQVVRPVRWDDPAA